MFKLSLKSALARKGRLLLTSLAVIAGCAFLSGVFVFSDTIRGTFDKLFANAYENTDAFVRSSNVIEADFGEESRDRVDDSLIPTIAATPGVSEAVGDVQSFARVSTLDGTEIGTDGPPKYGGVFTDSAASPWDLAEGTVPVGPEQVVIDRSSAKQGDIALGRSGRRHRRQRRTPLHRRRASRRSPTRTPPAARPGHCSTCRLHRSSWSESRARSTPSWSAATGRSPTRS
jgi:putative ABC transport system permease protein